MRSYICLAWIGVLTASLTLPTGCRKPEIKVYDVDKGSIDPPRALAQPSAASAAAEPIAWTPSPQWKSLPPTQFRKGNYVFSDKAGTAEITVTAFPGDTGGLLANANRWLRQASLPEISQEELDAITVEVDLDDRATAYVLDLKAKSAAEASNRIYAAVIPYQGQSWFFKMSGPFSTVKSQIPAFSVFLRGLKFGDEATSAGSIAEHNHGEHLGDLTFTAPSGWMESAGNSIRIASYSISKEGYPPADFSITSFPGDTGGLVANVNRWRGQIGLAPWSPEKVAAATRILKNPAGLEFKVFELKPESDAEKTVSEEWIRVAIMEQGGKSFFFKLKGDAVLVDLQRDEFTALLQSVHFSHEGHNH
ncbi:hypothetical protein IEN85_09445 [Pelagicoccus sp. NFK12]|uniref:Uncharacterized protein n=1 Tax=Pelagicoccus enzymogenes TaxID=2773457 RepID=A0A927IH10_9BACT|nr:hypothetical protein [Pelagicoccus enzymogenes]MBD5779716.1 hypothetical protein [Pelagicoccus enzymogenes]